MRSLVPYFLFALSLCTSIFGQSAPSPFYLTFTYGNGSYYATYLAAGTQYQIGTRGAGLCAGAIRFYLNSTSHSLYFYAQGTTPNTGIPVHVGFPTASLPGTSYSILRAINEVSGTSYMDSSFSLSLNNSLMWANASFVGNGMATFLYKPSAAVGVVGNIGVVYTDANAAYAAGYFNVSLQAISGCAASDVAGMFTYQYLADINHPELLANLKQY